MRQNNHKISKILVANRGEIAARIIRAARDLNIKTVIVYSEADEGMLPVRLADERILLSGSIAAQTYLHHDKIIQACIESGADAIHPGYGFLSENSEFAGKVEKKGLRFIGPTSRAIFLMGDKLRAREIAMKAQVPILEGMEYKSNLTEIKKFVKKIGYPVIVKASAGGSGRGIRVCEHEHDLEEKIQDASVESTAAFGSGVVYIEKYLKTPRHIEVQIVADTKASYAHIFERECSLQRRRQKLIEEAPAPRIHPDLAFKIRESALRLVKEVAYENVGTLEFLVDGGDSPDDPFYFLEMNTRLQVEHTVTEEVGRIDLCALQIQIAEGMSLKSIMLPQSPLGHAMQFRIYAEDPTQNFQPSLGLVSYCHLPSGPGIRVDAHVESGMHISPYYDALLAKIIVSGENRNQVIRRAKRALHETRIEGVRTNIEFFRWLIEQKDFIESRIHISWLDQNWSSSTPTYPSSFVGPLYRDQVN